MPGKFHVFHYVGPNDHDAPGQRRILTPEDSSGYANQGVAEEAAVIASKKDGTPMCVVEVKSVFKPETTIVVTKHLP